MQFHFGRSPDRLQQEINRKVVDRLCIVRGGGIPVPGRILSARRHRHEKRVMCQVAIAYGQFCFPLEALEIGEVGV